MVANTHRDPLDRFYTTPDVVDLCLATLDLSGYLPVEPSAGGGAFSSKMPGCVALDLSPEAEGIEQADFLLWVPPKTDRPIAVVGNPPYGPNGTLIPRFIKKACSFADLVAFILPLSYHKISMHSRWPKRFHLVSSTILPSPNATLFGELMYTRNVWQVWEKRAHDRAEEPMPKPEGWRACRPEEAHFAMRTVGGRLGRLSDPLLANKTSHLFFRVDGPLPDPDWLHNYLSGHEWPNFNMAQQSIGQRDFVPVINAALKEQKPK